MVYLLKKSSLHACIHAGLFLFVSEPIFFQTIILLSCSLLHDLNRNTFVDVKSHFLGHFFGCRRLGAAAIVTTVSTARTAAASGAVTARSLATRGRLAAASALWATARSVAAATTLATTAAAAAITTTTATIGTRYGADTGTHATRAALHRFRQEIIGCARGRTTAAASTHGILIHHHIVFPPISSGSCTAARQSDTHKQNGREEHHHLQYHDRRSRRHKRHHGAIKDEGRNHLAHYQTATLWQRRIVVVGSVRIHRALQSLPRHGWNASHGLLNFVFNGRLD